MLTYFFNTVNLIYYFPILLFIFISFILGVILTYIGRFLGPNNSYRDKNLPYECGFESFGSPRVKFGIDYYLIAIFFIIFDIEMSFMFPWGIVLRNISFVGYISMIIFLFECVLCYIYIRNNNTIDWE